VDEDGYLFLTGRMSELINRGGENIAPSEIDEALLEHPAVAQAAAFAVPHPLLGEDVAAAVVLKPGARVTEPELRQHVAVRLAPFKVPRVLRIVNEIPTGDTGKIQRTSLLAALGIGNVSMLRHRPEVVEPRGPIETTLATLWCAQLKVVDAGVHDDFIVSGGDSLGMAQLLERVRNAFDVEIQMADFLGEPTIAGLAQLLRRIGANGEASVPD
jgi:acyl carrier protein